MIDVSEMIREKEHTREEGGSGRDNEQTFCKKGTICKADGRPWCGRPATSAAAPNERSHYTRITEQCCP